MRRRTILLAILLLILLVAATRQPRVIVRAADAPSLSVEHQQQLAAQLEKALPNRDLKVLVILSDRVVASGRPVRQPPGVPPGDDDRATRRAARVPRPSPTASSAAAR
jgi:hypothetical protein